jgi:CYTH domain-containing protein
LNHTRNLEIERRWLIKLPLSEAAERAIKDEPDAPTRITQTYLTSREDGSVRRIRFVETDMWGVKFAHHLMTEKRLIERGVNVETEHTLTEQDYLVAMCEADEKHRTIDKTRYHVHHDGHILSLDIFHGGLEGVAILELEFKQSSECPEGLAQQETWAREEIAKTEGTFTLPDYLEVVKEITSENGWSNYELSLIEKQEEKSWFGNLLNWFRPKEQRAE